MRRRGALIVVDVQVDFCPGGALSVPEGDRIVPVLNSYITLFAERGCPIFATRDWHPQRTSHFREFGGVWPIHCVQESEGARFHPDLVLPPGTIVISKGHTPWEDGYSALQGVTENGTPLPMLLQRMELDRIYLGGLATDYCVKETTLGALQLGFEVTVLADAIAGIDLKEGDCAAALDAMQMRGARLATLEEVRQSLWKK
ncbi:isochorismatase family protein [Geomonas sp. RF6]|nr:isochorismatase family protein [Geomonas sp. RF6]UFS72840.1 isochorismatase family protein [Geomonas sp. RF6]